MIIKIANSSVISDFKQVNAMDDDPEITQYFKKTAAELKAIAPKAKDFLYFTCIMMHAAEAAVLDRNGNIRKTADGQDVQVSWDKRADGSWVWNTNDTSVLPYKNNNNDIFPEEELKKAYKSWVGKPLCLDHQSQSVDMIRGVIVDTVYDDNKKRIIALCALDKKNYPDLARKVASGYAASVSMGTAVGKAICTESGCHKVARVEADFCDHMRRKSCYGEINTELSPIELSIVVNPADPGAKIRRVIAASDAITSYIDKKIVDEQGMTIEEAKELKDALAGKIEEIQLEAGDNLSLDSDGDIEPPYGQQGRGALNPQIGETSTTQESSPQAGSTARFAQEILETLNSLKEKVSHLDNFINKMAFIQKDSNNTKEDNTMSEKVAYFQGGGGVNEPAPKQVKYPKEDSDKIRNNEDKQMVGQMDTGPVDGMHPGYDSFGESEEARKKRLLRMAEAEQRKMRREAAMNKAKDLIKQKREAYFLGGGGDNEPTPHKPKYPKEDSDSIRDKEDKQMVGAPPFPGVGKIDGLYGDDLATKEKLSRAHKLNARFVKASHADGSDNLADSRWDIYVKNASTGGRKLVLSATVKELAGKDRVASLFSAIATQDYGKKMIETIRTSGLDAATSIFKGAQAVAAPGGMPGAPVDAGGPAAVPATPADMPEEVDYAGETGSPADKLKDLVQELGNLHADLEQAVEALGEDSAGEAEMPGMATASVSLPNMAKTLKAALEKGMKQASAELEEVLSELSLIDSIYGQGVSKESAALVKTLVKEASEDAETAKKNALKMMASFVHYANGMEHIRKEAQMSDSVSEYQVSTDGVNFRSPSPEEWGYFTEWHAWPEGVIGKKVDMFNAFDGMSADDKKKKDKDEDKDDKKDKKDKDEKDEDKEEKSDKKDKKEKDEEEDEDENDLKFDAKSGQLDGSPAEVGEALHKAMASLSRAERDELRLKLAQKGLQFSDMLQKAHPKGGFKTELDVKPEGDLDKVETLPEVHDKVMDVAQAAPRNVRMAAEKIQMLVTAGHIDPAKDFPGLIAEGLDSEAVSYWKKMWGEAKDPEASKFVTELVKDYQKKKASEGLDTMRVKMARAYELAYSMAERGIIGRDSKSLSQQVDKVLNYSDDNFEHLQATVNRLPKKQASIAEVGLIDTVGHSLNEVTAPSGENSLVDQFSAAFSGRKY